MSDAMTEIDRRLEVRLRDAGEAIAYPATPDFVASTRRLINSGPKPAPVFPWRSVAFASVAATLLIALTIGVSSTTRDAVGRWLEIPGIRILDDANEPTATNHVALRDQLGAAVDLLEAAERAPYPLKVPVNPGLPDEAFYSEEGGANVVSMIYLADEALPPIGASDVGLLLTQRPSTPDDVWVGKRLADGGTVHVVRVNGVEALWIEGTHQLITLDDGDDAQRPAANVLSWHVDGITYRIESNLSLEQTLVIASSLAPVPGSGT